MTKRRSSSINKIVLAATSDLEFDQRMQRISQALHEAGYAVVLAGRLTGRSGELPPSDYTSRRIKCLFSRGPLFYLEFNFRLFLFLVAQRPDVISCADLDTLLAGWMAARLLGSKLVYDAHEYFPESPELAGRKFKRRLWYQLEAFLVPRVDAAYTVSEPIRELFREKYRAGFRVVRNLPALTRLPAGVPAKGYVIYQGALNIGRGLESLISSIPSTDLELWLAGEGDLSDQLREMAAETAPGKVKFMGRVRPDELRAITAGAVMGINLLEPLGLSYRYSLSNKFFDYIMAEIPQVSINFQEYTKINDQYEVAVMVSTTERDELVRAINALAGDRLMRQRLKENCRKAKADLNWDKEKEILLEIYRDV
jgi:glycosyltransferase involved in cell wall biosynthesis